MTRPGTQSLKSQEPPFWGFLPLAALIWLALLWALGAFLRAPPRIPPPPAIDVRLVELPDVRPEEKRAPAAPARPRLRATPRPELRPPRTSPPPPSPAPAPVRPAPPAPPVPPAPAPERAPAARPLPESAPTDMLSYINAKRARREAEDRALAQLSASERPPSEDEMRLANIRRNLQPAGANGVFQMLDIQLHSARFAFRAWMSNGSRPRRETVTVEARPGEDIRLAVVRRMIELIRFYNQGDFNWDSPRLGQVVVLSAREADTLELEDFLLREFFGIGLANLGL